MTDTRELAIRLHELAWAVGPQPAADPWSGAGGTRQERRTGALQLLAVYSQLIKVLQRRIDLTIMDALDAGSDYGEIASTCGVSRQAIRQRWLRRSTPSRWFEVRLPSPRPGSLAGSRPQGRQFPPAAWVRLVGGPHDGGHDVAVSDEVLVYEVDGPPSGSPGAVPLLACYVASQDDAAVYVFAGVERDLRRSARPRQSPSATIGRAKPRVYELAAEFGVESKVIMTKLQEMGEFTRSAASTVDHPVAERLREQLAKQARPKGHWSG